MENALILVIAFGVAVFIAMPFFKSGYKDETEEHSASYESAYEQRLAKLNSKKESLYAAIREFDFDYKTGKLTKEDFEELETQYKAQAVGVLKEIDEIRQEEPSAEFESEIEREIKSTRNLTTLSDRESIEREIRALRKQEAEGSLNFACPECGKEYEPEDRFCFKCGSALSA